MPLVNYIPANENPFALAAELSGKLLIDGILQPAQGGETFANINPATGAIIGQAAQGESVDVDLAVKAAARAQTDWGRMPARERGKLLVEGARMLRSAYGRACTPCGARDRKGTTYREPR